MQETAMSRMIFSSWCFCRPSSVSVAAAVLVPFLVLACLLAFEFSPFLATISVLFLSTIFVVTFLSKNAATAVVENTPTHDGSLVVSGHETLLEEETSGEPSLELDTVNQGNAAQQSEVCTAHEYQVESTDFPPDSESSDGYSASEPVEVCWVSSNNMGQDVALSESSLSDDDEDEEEDDNLIEISLPNTSPIDLSTKSEKKLQPYLPDYSPESVFMQEDLMELMAEIDEANEEENLIEIDLSMGSIKFEVEARGN